ncbi:MAG: hypothetical protein WC438_00035 [Candidatus Pacearchaeota archaeon]
MTFDIDVGFETRPKTATLDLFLKKQGYALDKESTKKDCRVYDNVENDLPTLFYYPNQNPDENPEWKEEGYNLVSLLNINFSDEMDEAERISRLVRDKFNGIIYEPSAGEFLRKGEG